MIIVKWRENKEVDLTYCRMSDIPKGFKRKFNKWMRGQTYAILDGEGAYYSWDVRSFFRSIGVEIEMVRLEDG